MQSNYQLSYSKKQNLTYLISEFFLFIYEIIVCFPQSIKFNYSLKNIDKRKLFIMGNGPSLQKDLRKIKKNSQIFAVNTFLSKNYFKSYKPNFLCCIDSMFWADFNRLSSSVKKSVQKTFIELNKADWHMKVFIPNQAKKIFESRIKNEKIELIIIPSLSYDFECSYYIKNSKLFKYSTTKNKCCYYSNLYWNNFKNKSYTIVGYRYGQDIFF